MKDQLHKEYGKLSAADIRLLLSMLEKLEHEELVMSDEILSDPIKCSKFFDFEATQVVWAGLYEVDFPTCLALIIHQFGIADDMSAISKSENPLEKLVTWIEAQKSEDDDDEESVSAEYLEFIRCVHAYNTALLKNIHALLVYGVYLNDLVKIAREGVPKMRDKALLDAIKIDPSVVGCKTATERISRAVLMKDERFLSKLRLALEGKLGAKEQATYKKMRYVLQLLHEANALSLPDSKLENLFVKELNLYHAPASAEKNLGEFARNFRKKKSTI